MLTKYAGKTIAETPFKDVQNPEKLKLARVVVVNDANGQQRNKLYPLQVGFKKYGQSGIEVSDWLPHIGDVRRRHRRRPLDVHHRRQPRGADAVPLRPAHARRRVPDARRLGPLRPGLAQRQPAAVHLDGQARVLERDATATTSAPRTTPCRSASIRPTRSTTASPKPTCRPRSSRSASTSSASSTSCAAVEYPDDPALTARIKSYELAFRMQKSVPEVLDFNGGDGGDASSSTASTSRRRATSACSCWPRGGWSSAACASSRSSTAPAARASGTRTAA